jgi:hypothetical protein
VRAVLVVALLLTGCDKESWCSRRLSLPQGSDACYRDCVLASSHVGRSFDRYLALNDCAVRICGGRMVCE